MKRLSFVDALRGLAVVGMVIIHQAEWWLAPVARRTGAFAGLYFLSKLVAPIFLTLVGVSLVLRFRGRSVRWADLRLVFLRGLKVLAFGYVFNLMVWLPVWGLEEIASWDVLQLVGLSIAVCGLLLLTPFSIYGRHGSPVYTGQRSTLRLSHERKRRQGLWWASSAASSASSAVERLRAPYRWRKRAWLRMIQLTRSASVRPGKRRNMFSRWINLTRER